MKKLDVFLIFLVTIASVAIFYSYFEKLARPNNASQLQVYFHSTNLAKPIQLEENTNLEMLVVSSEDLNKLTVTVTNKVTNSQATYLYNVTHKERIEHKIIITYNDIRVTEASCKGKDCMRMQMSHNKKVPIVCVLGISIMFEEFDIVV